MFGNILNGIPVVGHAKALLHYATGDSREGDRAMYAATRTSAVIAGGAAGVVAGPAGVLAGATGAGLAVDTVVSAASGRPQGVIRGVSDIVTDIENGDIPVGSVLKTGMYVGADALSGFGGGAIVNGVSGAVGKSIVKDAVVIVAKNGVACQMVAAGSVTRNVADSAPPSRPRSSRGSSTGSSSTRSNPTSTQTPAGSGSQPPNPNNNKQNPQQQQQDTHLQAFLNIFNVTSLNDVVIRGIRLFSQLDSGQVKSLKKLIKQLRLNGNLERVVKTVINLFNKFQVGDVNFQNFLSLTQFVSAYIGEEVAQRCQAQRAGQRIASEPFEERRDQNLADVIEEASQPRSTILATITQLYSEISSYSCTPNFRNIFSAIYHYFKHKVIPQSGDTLSVSDYYNIIRLLLQRVRTLTEYVQLTDGAHPRRELVFDRVITLFGNTVRIRIVLKIQDGTLELSSCYPLDVDCEDNEDGEEFIDPDKKRF